MARYRIFEMEEGTVAMDLSSLPLEPLPRLYAEAGLNWRDVKSYDTDELPEGVRAARWYGSRNGWFYDEQKDES
jgi:hypothetical protein